MNLTGAPRLARRDTLDYCAAAAVHLLREREARYPALVDAGKMTAAQSATGLELSRCIVAQWRWVMDATKPALPRFDPVTGQFGMLNYLLAAELDQVATRARANADREQGSWDKAELADLCTALAWWQQDVAGVARIAFWIDIERSAGEGRAGRDVERLAA